MSNAKSRDGFTKIEILVIIAVLVMVGGMLFPARTGTRVKAGRIKCVNNLKNVGLAFRIFSTDQGDRFPPPVLLSNGVDIASIDALGVFLMLTNELSTPKILYCPEDRKRKYVESFTNLSSQNISYFASLTATETLPDVFLAGDRDLQTNGVTVPPGLLSLTTEPVLSWSKEIHADEQGDIVMGDGSVQQFSSTRLRQAVKDQQVETNYLVIP